MSSPAQCSECAAILDELRSAAGHPVTPTQLRDALRATLPVILSADEETLEDLLEKHPFRLEPGGSVPAPRYLQSEFRAVFRRLWAHRARTGHWPLPFR